jgi:hypothetical protein
MDSRVSVLNRRFVTQRDRCLGVEIVEKRILHFVQDDKQLLLTWLHFPAEF